MVVIDSYTFLHNQGWNDAQIHNIQTLEFSGTGRNISEISTLQKLSGLNWSQSNAVVSKVNSSTAPQSVSNAETTVFQSNTWNSLEAGNIAKDLQVGGMKYLNTASTTDAVRDTLTNTDGFNAKQIEYIVSYLKAGQTAYDAEKVALHVNYGFDERQAEFILNCVVFNPSILYNVSYTASLYVILFS